MWELAFLNHEIGLVDDETWLAWEGYCRGLMMHKPGYAMFWKDNRKSYDARFLAHFDSATKE